MSTCRDEVVDGFRLRAARKGHRIGELENTPNPVSYSITWEDDWSKHLFPKLTAKNLTWVVAASELADRSNERCAISISRIRWSNC